MGKPLYFKKVEKKFQKEEKKIVYRLFIIKEIIIYKNFLSMNVFDTLQRAVASGIVEASQSFTAKEMLFLQGEVESRTEGQKALMVMPDVTEVRNTPLYADYDFEITSADTKVYIEHKDRGHRTFRNDDLVLSPKKYKKLLDLAKRAKTEGKECWYTSTRYGKYIYIWDMTEAPNYVYFAPLSHKKYTVDMNSPVIEEEMVFFPVTMAKIVGQYAEDNEDITS